MAKLNINGRVRDAQVEGDTPLLWVIREQVGLTGTKYGCGVAQGGACSVHLNGDVVRSCTIPKVETVIVPSYDFWGGVGEPTICVVTPAVLNAIHAATGKPVRSLPLKNVKLV